MTSNLGKTVNYSAFQDSKESCDLFGVVGYLVQLILALICFIVLVGKPSIYLVKRFMETPQRPWKIWFFDISKQGTSAVVVHSLNLILAVLLSTSNHSDQCIWYFIGNIIDTTIGVFICYISMYFIEKLAQKYDLKLLQSGLYYEIFKKDNQIKTKLNVKMYFSQLICWVCVVTISKCILFSFQIIIPSFLESVGEFILSPLKNSPNLKLIFIMILIPAVLNATQFWIQDNILKFKGNDEITNEAICDIKSESCGDIDSIAEGKKTDAILSERVSGENRNL